MSAALPPTAGVRVCAEKCSTCIFRPGNLMHLSPGRVGSMVSSAKRKDGVIPCHEFLHLPRGAHVVGARAADAVCRGFYDRHKTSTLQVAERLGFIIEVTPPASSGTS